MKKQKVELPTLSTSKNWKNLKKEKKSSEEVSAEEKLGVLNSFLGAEKQMETKYPEGKVSPETWDLGRLEGELSEQLQVDTEKERKFLVFEDKGEKRLVEEIEELEMPVLAEDEEVVNDFPLEKKSEDAILEKGKCEDCGVDSSQQVDVDFVEFTCSQNQVHVTCCGESCSRKMPKRDFPLEIKEHREQTTREPQQCYSCEKYFCDRYFLHVSCSWRIGSLSSLEDSVLQVPLIEDRFYRTKELKDKVWKFLGACGRGLSFIWVNIVTEMIRKSKGYSIDPEKMNGDDKAWILKNFGDLNLKKFDNVKNYFCSKCVLFAFFFLLQQYSADFIDICYSEDKKKDEKKEDSFVFTFPEVKDGETDGLKGLRRLSIEDENTKKIEKKETSSSSNSVDYNFLGGSSDGFKLDSAGQTDSFSFGNSEFLWEGQNQGNVGSNMTPSEETPKLKRGFVDSEEEARVSKRRKIKENNGEDANQNNPSRLFWTKDSDQMKETVVDLREDGGEKSNDKAKETVVDLRETVVEEKEKVSDVSKDDSASRSSGKEIEVEVSKSDDPFGVAPREEENEEFPDDPLPQTNVRFSRRRQREQSRLTLSSESSLFGLNEMGNDVAEIQWDSGEDKTVSFDFGLNPTSDSSDSFVFGGNSTNFSQMESTNPDENVKGDLKEEDKTDMSEEKTVSFDFGGSSTTSSQIESNENPKGDSHLQLEKEDETDSSETKTVAFDFGGISPTSQLKSNTLDDNTKGDSHFQLEKEDSGKENTFSSDFGGSSTISSEIESNTPDETATEASREEKTISFDFGIKKTTCDTQEEERKSIEKTEETLVTKSEKSLKEVSEKALVKNEETAIKEKDAIPKVDQTEGQETGQQTVGDSTQISKSLDAGGFDFLQEERKNKGQSFKSPSYDEKKELVKKGEEVSVEQQRTETKDDVSVLKKDASTSQSNNQEKKREDVVSKSQKESGESQEVDFMGDFNFSPKKDDLLSLTVLSKSNADIKETSEQNELINSIPKKEKKENKTGGKSQKSGLKEVEDQQKDIKKEVQTVVVDSNISDSRSGEKKDEQNNTKKENFVEIGEIQISGDFLFKNTGSTDFDFGKSKKEEKQDPSSHLDFLQDFGGHSNPFDSEPSLVENQNRDKKDVFTFKGKDFDPSNSLKRKRVQVRGKYHHGSVHDTLDLLSFSALKEIANNYDILFGKEIVKSALIGKIRQVLGNKETSVVQMYLNRKKSKTQKVGMVFEDDSDSSDEEMDENEESEEEEAEIDYGIGKVKFQIPEYDIISHEDQVYENLFSNTERMKKLKTFGEIRVDLGPVISDGRNVSDHAVTLNSGIYNNYSLEEIQWENHKLREQEVGRRKVVLRHVFIDRIANDDLQYNLRVNVLRNNQKKTDQSISLKDGTKNSEFRSFKFLKVLAVRMKFFERILLPGSKVSTVTLPKEFCDVQTFQFIYNFSFGIIELQKLKEFIECRNKVGEFPVLKAAVLLGFSGLVQYLRRIYYSEVLRVGNVLKYFRLLGREKNQDVGTIVHDLCFMIIRQELQKEKNLQNWDHFDQKEIQSFPERIKNEILNLMIFNKTSISESRMKAIVEALKLYEFFPAQSFYGYMKQVFQERTMSDITIQTKGGKFVKTHSLVLCNISSAFDYMRNTFGMVDDWKKFQSLHVEEFLYFLYFGQMKNSLSRMEKPIRFKAMFQLCKKFGLTSSMKFFMEKVLSDVSTKKNEVSIPILFLKELFYDKIVIPQNVAFQALESFSKYSKESLVHLMLQFYRNDACLDFLDVDLKRVLKRGKYSVKFNNNPELYSTFQKNEIFRQRGNVKLDKKESTQPFTMKTPVQVQPGISVKVVRTITLSNNLLTRLVLGELNKFPPNHILQVFSTQNFGKGSCSLVLTDGNSSFGFRGASKIAEFVKTSQIKANDYVEVTKFLRNPLNEYVIYQVQKIVAVKK